MEVAKYGSGGIPSRQKPGSPPAQQQLLTLLWTRRSCCGDTGLLPGAAVTYRSLRAVRARPHGGVTPGRQHTAGPRLYRGKSNRRATCSKGWYACGVLADGGDVAGLRHLPGRVLLILHAAPRPPHPASDGTCTCKLPVAVRTAWAEAGTAKCLPARLDTARRIERSAIRGHGCQSVAAEQRQVR